MWRYLHFISVSFLKVAAWTKYWVALCGDQLYYYPAKSLKATERKHVSSTPTPVHHLVRETPSGYIDTHFGCRWWNVVRFYNVCPGKAGWQINELCEQLSLISTRSTNSSSCTLYGREVIKKNARKWRWDQAEFACPNQTCIRESGDQIRPKLVPNPVGIKIFCPGWVGYQTSTSEKCLIFSV